MNRLAQWDPFPGAKQAWTSLVVAAIAFVAGLAGAFGFDVGWLMKLQDEIHEYGYLVVVAVAWFLRKKIDRDSFRY